MNRKHKVGKKHLLILFSIVIILIGATEPWWGGALLKTVLRNRGVTVEALRFHGYENWTLHGVSADMGNLSVEAETVTLPQVYPYLLFLWKHDARRAMIEIDGGSIQLPEGNQDSGSPLALPGMLSKQLSELNIADKFRTVLEAHENARDWVPRIHGENWTIEAGKNRLNLSELEMGDSSVRMTGNFSGGIQEYRISARLIVVAKGIEFEAEETQGIHRLQGAASLVDHGMSINLEGLLASGAFKLSYAEKRPRDGTGVTDMSISWKNPEIAHFLGRDSAFITDESEFLLDWSQGSYDVRVTGSGHLETGEELWQGKPWEVGIEASGSPAGLSVEEAQFEFPNVSGKLANPVAFSWSPFGLDREAELEVRVNMAAMAGESRLGELGWVTAQISGRPNLLEWEEPIDVSINARSDSDGARKPLVMEAQGLASPEYFQIKTGLIHQDKSRIELDGATLQKQSGQWELENLSYSAELDFETLDWIPAHPLWPGRLASTGSLGYSDGRLTYVVDLDIEGLEPGNNLETVSINGKVRGRGWEAEAIEVEVANPRGGKFMAGGQVMRDKDQWKAKVTSLRWVQDIGESTHSLVLSEPVELRMKMEPEPESYEIAWTSLLLSGSREGEPRQRITLGPGSMENEILPAKLDVEVAGISNPWVESWLKSSSMPLFSLDNLSLQWSLDGDDTEAEPEINLKGKGTLRIEPEYSLDWSAKLTQDGNGFNLDPLTVRLNRLDLATVTGSLPGRVRIGSGGMPEWKWNPAEKFSLEGILSTSRESLDLKWKQLTGKITGVDGRFQLSGDMTRPRGDVEILTEKLELSPMDKGEGPETLKEIQLRGTISPDGFELTEGGFLYENQPVRVSGTLPMNKKSWGALWRGEALPDFGEAQAGLETGSIPLSILSPWLPPGINPDLGVVQMTATLEPGLSWGADLHVSGVRLGYSGTGYILDKTTGDFKWRENGLEIRNLQGMFSGRKLSAEGFLSFDQGQLHSADLKLNGERLPLIRENDLFLRADIDLRLEKEPGDPHPWLRGLIRPRDGLYMKDFLGMLQPGTQSAEQRPPYFSIEVKPFADWNLDVDVRGEKALRINTSLFRGVLSTDMRLVNTLYDPRLNGDIILDRGTIYFPYGRIRTEKGEVRFNRGNPYNPEIDINGSGRAFGYDIDMNLSGPVSEARIEFEADPPLKTEEVLFMLTSGAMPGDEDTGSNLTAAAGQIAFYLGRGLVGGSGTGGERLRITTGEDITEEGRETFSVEFEIRDDLSVIGEYDKFDDYNLDFRWTIRGQ